jgi:hypothetical protein
LSCHIVSNTQPAVDNLCRQDSFKRDSDTGNVSETKQAQCVLPDRSTVLPECLVVTYRGPHTAVHKEVTTTTFQVLRESRDSCTEIHSDSSKFRNMFVKLLMFPPLWNNLYGYEHWRTFSVFSVSTIFPYTFFQIAPFMSPYYA